MAAYEYRSRIPCRDPNCPVKRHQIIEADYLNRYPYFISAVINDQKEVLYFAKCLLCARRPKVKKI